jgi:hypothetical protein
MTALAGLAIPPAQARPLPPNGPYGVLCTCGDLTVTSSDIVGNVGIGDGGSFIGSTADGPGTITGTVLFSGADNPPSVPSRFLPDGITAPGGLPLTAIFNPPANNNVVQNDITATNTTSLMLSRPQPQGAPLTISGGGSISVAGTDPVFNATIARSFVAGKTFTISGDGTGNQAVTINIDATGSVSFDGSIMLTGGLTSDQVLFNFDGGDFATNSGGPVLTIDTTPFVEPSLFLAAATPSNAQITMGTFFNPNGEIHVVNSKIDGRVFGGPTDFTITDSTIDSPASSVPEPASLTLVGAGLVAFGVIRRRHRSLPIR